MEWLKERLTEKSTYTGLALLAAAFGAPVIPVDLLIEAGAGLLAVLGIIETVSKEKKADA